MTKIAKTTKTRSAKKPVAAKAPKSPKAAARRVKKAAAAAGTTISYPFESKKQITARIQNDPSYALAAVVQLQGLNGAMCSQKKLLSTLAGEIAEAGESASQNESLVARAQAFAVRYARRLAKENRVAALAANPDLTDLAKLFSAA